MSLPMIALLVVALGAAGILVYLVLRPGEDILGRIAALDAASGVDKDKRSIMERLSAHGNKREMAQRLLEAGWKNVTPQMMVQRSIVGFCVGFGVVGAILIALHLLAPLYFLIALILAVYGGQYPYSQLENAAKKRKMAIHRELPNFLDILATTVDAGVALNGALMSATEQITGPLKDEMEAAVQDIRLGRSRADALLAMAQRVREEDLSTTTVAIVQAEKLGTQVVNVLLQLAADMREKRFMRAEEIAASLSNKLVFPVGLCMMPALMLMIFGAALSKFFK
jgi:tight adherence protein C